MVLPKCACLQHKKQNLDMSSPRKMVKIKLKRRSALILAAVSTLELF